jgi:hypothetical protein
MSLFAGTIELLRHEHRACEAGRDEIALERV